MPNLYTIWVRRLCILAGLLVLTACGGGSTAVTCESGYWDGAVGTCVPEGWQVLDRLQLDQKGMPPEVIVAFQSETPVSGQFITVTVTREGLTQPLSSVDYSEASMASVQGLPNYEELDRQSVTVDDDALTIHIFTAQPSTDQPVSKFYQLSAVSQNMGYTFTAATPVSVPDEVEAQVLSMLNNVTFREQGETTE